MNSLETSSLPLMAGRSPQPITAEHVDAGTPSEPGTAGGPAPFVFVDEEEFAAPVATKSASVTVRFGSIDRTEKSVDLSPDPGRTDGAPVGTCCCPPSSAGIKESRKWMTYYLDQTNKQTKLTSQ